MSDVLNVYTHRHSVHIAKFISDGDDRDYRDDRDERDIVSELF